MYKQKPTKFNGFVELMKPARWDRDVASEADCVIVNVEFTESTISLNSYASVQKAQVSVWHTVAIRLSCADCDV